MLRFLSKVLLARVCFRFIAKIMNCCINIGARASSAAVFHLKKRSYDGSCQKWSYFCWHHQIISRRKPYDTYFIIVSSCRSGRIPVVFIKLFQEGPSTLFCQLTTLNMLLLVQPKHTQKTFFDN